MSRPEELMASIHSANVPAGGRLRPVPKMASSTICAPSSLSSLATSTPELSSALSSAAAGPVSLERSAQHTDASRPQRCRWRAAARPSPPLLPGPHTTAVGKSHMKAARHPAASMSHSTEMPNCSAVSWSSSATWRLLSVGSWALDDKGAVGVAAVDRVGLRHGRAQQLREKVRRDGADLRKLQRGVPERAVVDGDLHTLLGFGLLRQRPGATDPGDNSVELLIEGQAAQVGFDGLGVPGGDAAEEVVEGLVAAHVAQLLEDHRRQLPIALREDGVGALGEGEKEGRTPPGAALRMVDDEAVTLEVGQVLPHGVGGHAQVRSHRLGTGRAFAPEELEDLHASRAAG